MFGMYTKDVVKFGQNGVLREGKSDAKDVYRKTQEAWYRKGENYYC